MKRISFLGLGIALTAVATMAVQIPIPATKEYLNLGDSVIMVLAVVFGPRFGFLVGSLGSALADVVTGYVYWAPATLIIKGVEGFLVGWFSGRSKQPPNHLKLIWSFAVGAITMAVGYFIAGAIMYGGAAALADTPANLVQGIGSVVVALPLTYALKKLRFLDREKKLDK
ncbi:MAG TPA: ECF transporter S component [Bacillota bacterium]|nr:ECF transporter S component [Bacillota bacterium]